jgi:hypothetical protein
MLARLTLGVVCVTFLLAASLLAQVRETTMHGPFDRLLKAHVDEHGFIDYEAIAADRADLDAYLKMLAEVDLGELRGSERFATLINAYNAFMIDLVLQEWPVENITADIDNPFKSKRWTLGGKEMSLDDVEHATMRTEFDDPRLHWAVVCGAFSCPKLRNEAYVGSRLDRQLHDQAVYVHNGPRFVQYDGGDTIKLTKLYLWYAGDFEGGNVLEYVARYRPDVRAALDEGRQIKVEFIDYSWDVNDQRNREKLGR